MKSENAGQAAGAVLKVERAGKRYALARRAETGSHDFWALKDVSFEVVRGKVLGIIGRNGAGKTTLLNAIAGVLPLTEGEIKVSGRVLGLFNLGVGFQDELTGRENVFLNGTILGASREELENKFNAILDFSELGEFINMPMGTYSQGMRLRLAFSIIANLDFEVLLMDEVLAVGDALFQSKCFERLMDFKRAGKTLVLTTQSMEMIERLCDEVHLLDHGKLVFSGDPAAAASQYRALLNSEQFYVGSVKEENPLVENTKKWTDDISEWGKKLGTRETVIRSVGLYNRWGFRTSAVKSGQFLKIRVVFDVRNAIKEPHFGIAIFRSDGVYCYGPNTMFDRQLIREMKPGKGWFELQYGRFDLAPGDYKISVAIWDKKESLAYDYHNGCYDVKVSGSQGPEKELLNISGRINSRPCRGGRMVPLPEVLKDPTAPAEHDSEIGIASVRCKDALGNPQNTFRTNDAMHLGFELEGVTGPRKRDVDLWVGLFRDDGVYCQSFMEDLENKRYHELFFRTLPLLPGGYKIAVGAWDRRAQKFLFFRKDAVSFRMVFNKEDHGTVYLKHAWKWELAR